MLIARKESANADLDSLAPRFAVEARKEIQTHLAALFAAEESQQEQEKAATEVVAALPEATVTEVVTCSIPTPLPVALSEAEREELAQETAVRHDWIAERGKPQREVHGLYRRTADCRYQHDRSRCA